MRASSHGTQNTPTTSGDPSPRSAQADTDGNAATAPDPNWTPLINTPPFPEYVSGHSAFSGVAAVVLSDFFGSSTGFTVGSPTLAGVTRTSRSFDAAANEAGISRLYGGIHFLTSINDGLVAGLALGHFVLQKFGDLTDDAPPTVTFLTPTAGSAEDQLHAQWPGDRRPLRRRSAAGRC